MINRQMIVDEARDWLGTPYRHTGSSKEGVDCAGLIRGVYRAVVGPEPDIEYPSYSPDWAVAAEDEVLLPIMREQFHEVPSGDLMQGDVLVFRMGIGAPAKHMAIISAPGQIIHAYWGRSVCETRLVPWWSRRICAAFQFPGV